MGSTLRRCSSGDTGYLSNKAAMDGYAARERKFFGHFPVGRQYKLNPVHPQLESACFQPLEPEM